MLPEQPVIFLVDTDRILDLDGAAIVSNEAPRLKKCKRTGSSELQIVTYEIVYSTDAIASQGEVIRHRTHTIFATGDILRMSSFNVSQDIRFLPIKGEFSWMWEFWGTVRDNHFCERQTIEYRTYCSIIVIRHSRNCDPFTVVKS